MRISITYMDKQTEKELLDIVRRNYEAIASEFSETRKKYLWPELIKLTRAVKDGDKILDVGCGNGRLLEAFLGKQIKYLGVDQSDKLLTIARQDRQVDMIKPEFIKGDILELGKIPELNFNHVFAIAVLHHLPGRDLQIKALKQLRNKLADNGRIIVVVWNMWSKAWKKKNFRRLIIQFALLKLIKKNLPMPVGKMDFGDIVFDWKNSNGKIIGQRYYHAFRRRELKKIIKKAGLKTKRLYKDKYNYYAIITK